LLYPPEIIEEVRSLNDIVEVVGGYVQLRPKSGNHFGLCPFHREKTPSFSVSSDKQMFKCFGCGAGGNVFSFVMQMENFDFLEALKFLADRVHYILPKTADSKAVRNRARIKELLEEINRKAARFFYDGLQAETPDGTAARAYLYTRGVVPKTQVKFGLGLSPPGWDSLFKYLTEQGYKPEDIKTAGLAIENKTGGHYDRFRNRLMFPILDIGGKVVGFGGRQLDGRDEGAKYLNSPETPLFEKGRQLYGLYVARKARSREILLVEGYMDAVSLNQAGFANAVAALGTALTSEHARLLKRVNCESAVLLMDNDEAGERAALHAIPVLLEAGLRVRVLQVPDAKDPDEYINKFGAERFRALIAGAQSHIHFRLGVLKKEYPLYETEQRTAFTQAAAELLSTLSSEIETDVYVQEIAAQTKISAKRIDLEIGKARAGQAAGPGANLSGWRRSAVRTNDSGLQSACKNLIQLLFASSAACRALFEARALHPDEIGDGFYASFLSLALDTAKTGYSLIPADAVSRFETLEEQNKAADVFSRAAVYESDKEIEKALNDMIHKIKDEWFVRKMSAAKDGEGYDIGAINELFEARRTLTGKYVSFANESVQ